MVWAPVWPWGKREVCAIHWSGRQGVAGDGAGCTAWSGGARPPACGARAPPWVSGYDDSCKRKRRSGRCSPRLESGCAGVQGPLASTAAGGAGTSTVTRSAQGFSGHGLAQSDPAGRVRGVREGSGSPAAEKCGDGGAYRRRGGSAPLGARRGDALGLRAARGVDGVQGGSQGGLKGGVPVISGFGLGRKPARISGGRRGRCAGERCGDDGSDPWGRPVSGTQRRGRGRASEGVGGWASAVRCGWAASVDRKSVV